MVRQYGLSILTGLTGYQNRITVRTYLPYPMGANAAALIGGKEAGSDSGVVVCPRGQGHHVWR